MPGAHEGAGGKEEEAGRGTGEWSSTLAFAHAAGAWASTRGERGRPSTSSSAAAVLHAEPSPHHHSGPGFNHPSITHCLLLLTAHLLALVKHAENSERNSPALPDRGTARKGPAGPSGRAPAGGSFPAPEPALPRRAGVQDWSTPARTISSHGRETGGRALKSAEDPPPPLGNKGSARPGFPRPKVHTTKCP